MPICPAAFQISKTVYTDLIWAVTGSIMFKASAAGPVSDNKLILRPLIGLMSDQSPEEIERHVVREIEKHRRLRNDAVMLEGKVDAATDSDTAREASQGYIQAMIAVHAQQTVVSTLLDILGYIPDMPRSKGH
jgi:hypothetical protein